MDTYDKGVAVATARIVGYQVVIALMMSGTCYFGAAQGSPWLGYLGALAIGATAAVGAHAAWLRTLQYVTVVAAGWLLWDTMDGDPILGWISAYWPHALAVVVAGATARAFLRKPPEQESQE